MQYRLLLLLVGISLFASTAIAQRDAKIPDPDPELERKTFVLPPGFEVNLFAADPMLAKPIQMNFDPQGRLWVAASEVYPQIKPGQKAIDRVLILEDTDGDGKADKTTVFADGLLIPTGVAPGDGGVYVADSTDLVHFSDPDPTTGKARQKRIVLSGFGTEDTHHILHTFRWGFDGLLYMSQSIYIHSHIETPHGVRRLNAGGIWQYRPETEDLGVFARGWVNSWGTQFDRWGATFATDGAGGEGINYAVPGAAYVTAAGVSRILPGLNPGSPKLCGLAILSGRHLPPEYQGNLIANDFRGHRVCRYVVKDDGAGFASQEKQELIKSSHPAFRPIDIAMGPDGAIYIADWYNPIIQHGEVDFRDPRRDHTHGRIWRITAKDRPLVEKPKLVGAAVPDLLDQLKQPEDFTRVMAKRVLKERGAAAVTPALAAWVSKLDPTDAEFEHHRLESLWLYQSIDVVEPKLLTAVLNSPDPRARAAACRVASMWANRLPNPLELLAPRAADDHAQVRLEAVRALAVIPSAAAATTAAKALDKPVDRWLDYALWQTFRDLAPYWLADVQAGQSDLGGNPRHLIFALQSAGTADVTKPLVALLQSGKLAKDREVDVLATVASLGGPAEFGLVMDRAATSIALRNRLLPIIADTVRSRKIGPPAGGRDAVLLAAITTDTGPSRQAAALLAGLWKVAPARPALEQLASGKPLATPEDQQAGFDGLVALGGPKSIDFLKSMSAESTAPLAAIMALAQLDPTTAAGPAVARLSTTIPLPEAERLVAAFVGRKTGPADLAKALGNATLTPDVAKIALRAAKATGQPDPTLVDALTKAGKLTETRWKMTGKDLDQFLTDVPKLGDPARGERIYRRAELTCLKCHGIAGAGGQVGPDMTSIGASAPVDYLLQSLVDPNAKVKEGFNSFIVNLEDGRVVTGIKVRETKTELVLRDAEDKELVLPIGDIASRKDGKSLMPEGLIDGLTRQELLDLTRFLSELGKSGPYAAVPGRVVRRWQAVQPNQALYTMVSRDRQAAIASPTANLDWVPVYSLVSGDLSTDALPTYQLGKGPKFAVVRFQIDVTTAGKVKLNVRDPAGLAIWLNGTPVEAAGEIVLDLPAGVQTVTFTFETEKRTLPLRVELDDVAGSPARARVLGGK